jgi:hypothetical protein
MAPTCVPAGIRREADENSALLGYYATSGGNFLTTFRDYLLVPSSQESKRQSDVQVLQDSSECDSSSLPLHDRSEIILRGS